MRGIPGSGKSKTAKDFIYSLKKETVEYCSADDFHVNKSGVYNFRPELAGNAHLYCMKTFLDAIEASIDHIVVDNTNTQVWEYTPYVQVALASGYLVKIIEVTCDQQVAFERQTHGVPYEHHTRMHNRFQPVLPHHRSITKTIDNTHYTVDHD